MSQHTPSTRFINPSTMPQPTGYTHIVEASGGRTIYIAGQVALDLAGNIVGRVICGHRPSKCSSTYKPHLLR